VEHSADNDRATSQAALHTGVVAETRRLVLRHILPEDFSFFAALFRDPEVMRFSTGLKSDEETRATIDRAQASYRNRGYGPWAVQSRATGEIIGFCGLLDQEIDGRAEVEVGYRLAQTGGDVEAAAWTPEPSGVKSS